MVGCEIVSPTIKIYLEPTGRCGGERHAIMRVLIDRRFQKVQCTKDVLFCQARKQRHCPEIKIVRAQFGCGSVSGSSGLSRLQFRLDNACYTGSNVVLEVEHIFE